MHCARKSKSPLLALQSPLPPLLKNLTWHLVKTKKWENLVQRPRRPRHGERPPRPPPLQRQASGTSSVSTCAYV
jgi:hypothetical protein